MEIQKDYEGLEPGYYYLTAEVVNVGAYNCGVLYGRGKGQKECTTTLPLTTGGVTEGPRRAVVRGIRVGDDGTARVGLHIKSCEPDSMGVQNLELVREANQSAPYRFYKGGDISELSWLEAEGAAFHGEDGGKADALELLAANGWNIARLRVYDNPGKGRGNGSYYCKEGYMTLQDVLGLAKRAKALGMELELTIHYSDYWTNVDAQRMPQRWEKELAGLDEAQTLDKLCKLVYQYTCDVMRAMKAQGTEPEFVSIGNEIQGGILYPYGHYTKWENLARLLSAGSRAVTDICPDSRVIMHLDNAGQYDKYYNFFDNCVKYGVPYDVIGPSYYPFWFNKDVDTVVEFCNKMIERYQKDIMIMETGYNFSPVRPDGYPGQLEHNGPYPKDGDFYGSTPLGQKHFMEDLFNGLKSVGLGTGHGCLGDLYWDPVMVEQTGIGWALKEADDQVDVNLVSNTTLFDFEHKLLPVMGAYRWNKEG
ncbi:MAG: glycosyl hydrolase 53 family protein [Lachnospiraceae bacterium]|nr:glycosyl hydrolase 53 family protein [Lachnospiraceae bacterium]